MININKKAIRMVLLAVAVLSLVTGVLRVVILSNYLEPDTGFYIRNTSAGLWFNVCVAAVLMLILACGLATRKTKTPEYLDSKSMIVVFTSALCVFMYFSVFAAGAYTVFTTKNASLFLYAEVVLCVPCCLNHVTICSKEIREKNTPHALFATSEAVFFAVRTVENFMDKDTQINTSHRTLELVLLCAIMMYFVTEAGFFVKREDASPSVPVYCMSGLAVVAFTFIFLIPHLASCLIVPGHEVEFVLMSVLDCCVMLFAASRILTLKNQID